MKIWISRFGKVINSIRTDGFLNASLKVKEALGIFNKRVDSGDVLFVTGGVGRSAVYRCHNQAEELNNNNIKASVAVQDNKKLLDFADSFLIFIFHRTLRTKELQRFIARIKESQKTILFETDDLNYDPEYLHKTEYYNSINKLEKQQIKKGIAAEILNDDYVKTCVTSTTFLSKKLEEYDKNVFVSRNKLSKMDIKNIKKVLKGKEVGDGLVRMGYFSGSPSHNKDFATIEDVLVDILRKYPQTHLVIVGPLELDDKFSEFESQIERLKFVPMKELFKVIAKIDINLAPLLDDEFSRSKSEIKFLEAGILRVPTVAFANQTFKEIIEDGKNGMLAKNKREWTNRLRRLIEDKKLRVKIGNEAQISVLKQGMTESRNGNKKYYDFLRNEIKSSGSDKQKYKE